MSDVVPVTRCGQTGVWIRQDGPWVRVGLTDDGLSGLGDDVHAVHFPPPGRHLRPGDVVAVFESSKAAIDVESPLEGFVEAVNGTLVPSTELLSFLKSLPEHARWLVALRQGAPEP